ncbi:MAG: hypothetical protein M3498_16720 [Deinococcota bacterium]|jgi:hypothetical protein|nr:hypothetical protein [Deinococcota bacterium]
MNYSMRAWSLRIYEATRRQGTRLWPIILVGVGFILLCCGGVYLLAKATGTPLSALTADPAAINRTSVYIGLLSNIGIMLWSATAAVGFLAAAVLRMLGHSPLFLLASASLSVLLAVDDAFLLHERVIPRLLQIPEIVVYGGYGLLIGSYLLYFSRPILKTDYELLVLAFLCFAISVAIDIALPTTTRVTFVEDSFKLAGIVFWLLYFFRAAQSAIRSGVSQERSRRYRS